MSTIARSASSTPSTPAGHDGEGRTAAQLKRPFLIGVLFCVCALIVIAGVVRLADDRDPRPEGTAERWLTDVSDTTRKGVKADATKRAEEIGPIALAASILPTNGVAGKGAFPDLEVGKATVAGASPARTARVPYQVHQRSKTGSNPKLLGTIVLAEQPDRTWKVTSLEPRLATERTPAEGGDLPSGAPAIAWVLALAAGVVITALCALAVTAAGKEAEALGLDTSIAA